MTMRFKAWWLWLLIWSMVSAVAIAGDFSASLSERVFQSLQQRLPSVQSEDFELSWLHPEQLQLLERRYVAAGYGWRLDLPKQASLLGRVGLPVLFTKGDQPSQRVVVGCEVRVQVPVVQVLRNMDKGSELTLADVKVFKQSVATVPYQALRDQASVLGKRARLALRQGALLMPWMVGNAPLVQENDPVQIVLKGRAFVLKVSGVALQDGARDEEIRVKNSGTQKVLLARVTDAGQVSVLSEL